MYWCDILAQALARRGRKASFKQQLHPCSQEAIDRGAMRAGRGLSDRYPAAWRRESEPCEGDPEQAVEASRSLKAGRRR